MNRIKENMEIISTELEGFQKEVSRLKTIKEDLKDLRVSIDLSELKAELRSHKAQLERQREYQNEFYSKLESTCQKIRVYTNRIVITIVIALLITGAALIYTYNKNPTLQKLKNINQAEQLTPLKPQI